MLNEGEEKWANAEEELSQPSIRSVWRMPLSRGIKLIKKMSTKAAKDLTAIIIEKQKKLLYRISKLEQLMDDAVHALVEKVNSQGTPTYQEEIEGESSTLQTEEKIKTIHNFITNLISEEKLPTILKEIQEVINQHPKVISKGEWDIGYTNLIEHEIYFEHDHSIKKLVRYINLRLAD